MKRSTYAILALAISLVGSNLWWIYHTIDAGVTATYREASFDEKSMALKQQEAILLSVLNGKRSKAEIVAAAKSASRDFDPFEKEGFTHVGWVRLKFDAKNQLLEVVSNE